MGVKQEEATYPIRAVSKLTGLTIDTLRAWERRYGAVSPDRSGRGRTYNEDDILRLKLLREAVAKGHRIGDMAALTDRQLKELMRRSLQLGVVDEHLKVGGGGPEPLDLSALLTLVDDLDYVDADREFGRLATLLSPRDLIYQLVVPLMQEVGNRWYKGALSVAQEHMVSSILRNLLGGLVRLYQRANPTATLLFATSTGEHHEFGILAAAMLAARSGLGIIYLGASLPVEEILAAAEKTSPKAIVLGAKGAGGWVESLRDLKTLAQRRPVETELWVGGIAQQSRARELKQIGAVALKDFADFEQHVTRLGGQVESVGV